MSRLAWGAGAASVALVLGVVVKHDRDEAQRYDRMFTRLATLEETARTAGEAVAAPQWPMGGACRLDSAELDAIARVVRESASASAPRDGAPHAAESPNDVPRTPEQAEAMARARTILDGMLKRRRMTRDDAVELRRELNATGSLADVQEIQRRISVAINRDELVPDDPQLLP